MTNHLYDLIFSAHGSTTPKKDFVHMKSFSGCQMQLICGFLEALIFKACNMTTPLHCLDYQTVSIYFLHTINFEEGKCPLLRYVKVQ